MNICTGKDIAQHAMKYIDMLTLDPDPDPNWAKILDLDPNSMYWDPQHCTQGNNVAQLTKHRYSLPQTARLFSIKFHYFKIHTHFTEN